MIQNASFKPEPLSYGFSFTTEPKRPCLALRPSPQESMPEIKPYKNLNSCDKIFYSSPLKAKVNLKLLWLRAVCVSEEISVLFRGIREKESLRRSSWSWVEWSAKSTKDLISENAFFTEYSLWASCTPQLDFRRGRNIQPVHNRPLSSSLLCTQAKNIQRGYSFPLALFWSPCIVYVLRSIISSRQVDTSFS